MAEVEKVDVQAVVKKVRFNSGNDPPQTAHRASIIVGDDLDTYLDTGSSSTIDNCLVNFIHLVYHKRPFLIDTAEKGVTMRTHFSGTTRTEAKGDGSKWV